MKGWVGRGMAVLAVLLLAAAVAEAQPAAGTQGADFGIRVPPAAPVPPAPRIRFEPTHRPEQTRAPEQEYYPGHLVLSRHEPAFLQPFVVEFPVSRDSTAWLGLSGWTAPALPYDVPESGGVAIGLTAPPP
jgi:hypothetical protein